MRTVLSLLVVLALAALLRRVPVVSGLGSFWTFWLAVLLFGVLAARATAALAGRETMRRELRRLAEVDSAHNLGKLGALWLSHGSPRRAVPLLERAAAGEGDVIEWRYRLGQARLAVGDPSAARDALREVAAADEEYAYGGAQLLLAQAELALDDAPAALRALDTFDRNHGPNPESAFRRGQALRELGQREEARRSFEEVQRLAQRAARFQRAHNRSWRWRARLARAGLM